MKVIVGNPGTGKTRRLIELSAEKNIPILAESGDRVRRILTKADGYGIRIPLPITPDEIDDSVQEVLVDDLGRFFRVFFGVKLECATINNNSDFSQEVI